ncbi:GrpB family protein [Desulfobacula sp.]|uniref:GrpB family protein n=1 Tax=Desulfobacula sp. TaxID=2593537 RepID=UPI0025C23448|nr:GrpB family protein [Desulfobacula sp.]MBC2703168.1 GrpB family protein [Desulfobacula sp.]
MKKYKLEIVDYDTNWPRLFIAEKEILNECISEFDPVIEHIGSTSIPKLAAKPIIDIAVGIDDFNISCQLVNKIQAVGYYYEPELEEVIPDFKLLWKGEKLKEEFDIHRIHVIIQPISSRGWTDSLIFRDYLLDHADDAKTYGELKRGLSERYVINNATYNKAKSIFIREILSKARKIQ